MSSSSNSVMSTAISPRLGVNALRGLPGDVTRPPFTPGILGTGIVHLGCGAFHRAHQALITQHAMSVSGDRRWGIASVAMSRPEVVGALKAQDNLYTTLLRDEGAVRAEVVGALTAAVHAPSDRIGVVRRLADPRVRIVTLTVTTGGYCLSPATGRLDSGSEPVRHDLRCAAKPCTAIGMLVGGLAAVKRRGGTPPVVISCDNLSANGRQLRSAVIDFAAMRDDRLANWIARHVQFPCSVVDRIVSSTESDDAARTRLGGVDDRAPVSAEPFMTWTIENFEGERPRWDLAGADFVADVTAHELAKLRLLNGTHLLLAYVGALAGYPAIAEAGADPVLSELARQFMLYEQGPTLTLPQAELHRTVNDLLRRFRNPALRHEVTRVGRNGSDKMLPRVTAAMLENHAHGRPTPGAALLIAAWIRWFDLCGTPGTAMEVIDARAAELAQLAAIPDPHRRARAFLSRTDIFGELPEPIHQEVGDALAELIRDNARKVAERRLRPEFIGRVA